MNKFTNFAKTKETPKSEKKQIRTRHLQVRMILDDAKRFKRTAEDKDLSIQDALIEAANKIMQEWGQAPVANPGSSGKA